MDAHVVPLAGEVIGFAFEFKGVAQCGCDVLQIFFGGGIIGDEIVQRQNEILGNSCPDPFDCDGDHVGHQPAGDTGFQVINILAPAVRERRIVVTDGDVRVALVKTGDSVFIDV